MTGRGDWDPIRDLLSVQKRMNQLFESALGRTDFEAPEGIDAWSPVGDVFETPGALVISLELPGLDQSQIDLRIDGDELVVEGERIVGREREGDRFHRVERSYGKFARRVRLPSNADRDGIQAQYRNGLLTVTLPKTGAAEPKSVKVSID